MNDITDRRSILRAGGAGLVALAAGSLPLSASAEPTAGGTLTDLGEPVHKTQTQSSAIANGPDGRPLAYLCAEGNPTTPGEFAVVDLRARKTILDVRIAAGASIGRNLSISPTTGDVWFGTSDGAELYRYTPGATAVEHLGSVSEDQRIWALRAGDDGTIWIGTYPGGLLLSYDPETGETTDHGQALAGEQYIGSVQQVGGLIYCGTQPNGRLASYDPATGTFTEVALPDGPVASDITELNLRGSLLFVTTGARTYVLDTESGQWIDTIPEVSGYGVSPVDPRDDASVYVRSGNVIKRYHTQTRALEPIGWSPNATPETWAWVDLADPASPGLSIAFTYWNNGRIYAFNPDTSGGYYLEPDLLGAGTQLVAIAAGPDGAIYCGAYLSPPGMGRWDPDREAFELLTGTSQVEGFGTFGNDLVFGRYPQGRLYRYELDRPWAMGTNPGPAVDLDGRGQNRPQCFVQLSETRMAVTSVPITGRHGGAITLWDPLSNEVEVYDHVIRDQTPVSLVLHDGLLIGGTSINGGYGIDPVTPEAKLFGWDPETHKIIFETVPVRGATTVAGLIMDEHDRLWGLADNVIFEFDPVRRVVRHRARLFDEPGGSRYGNDHVLLLRDDRLYGVTAGRLFEFNRRTRRVEVLDDTVGARHLAADRAGDLYVIGQATRLYRYRR
ncbi:ligand-binding sensor domain-containing protein [Microlunatus parietis]|uniref:Outer membrane protein assembly factor BamB n=1 Tax=Microlunatus parietis TaxID=682979 RepID=A0A7Y9I3T8_9ACTN|nr:hypothetical protein [Microlunatus parietis]NYE69623.1 outer membrane protein assembly factor BamB [Microlunatus parietis]